MNIRYPIYEGVYRILTHQSPANMQRTPRTSRTVAENKSRDTIPKDEKIRFTID